VSTARIALLRHSRTVPCPVCDGHAGLEQGRGVRCAGFTLDRVVYCTREEYAGRLPVEITVSPPAYKHRLWGPCDCGCAHGWAALREFRGRREPKRTQADVLPVVDRHVIYSHTLELLTLRPEALADLARRGLSAEVVRSAGYRSLPRRGAEHQSLLSALIARFGDATVRRCPGFTDKNDRLNFWTSYSGRDGYVVPYKDEAGRKTGLQAKFLGGKYVTPYGTRLAHVYHVAGANPPGGDLYLTEGATKANVASYLGELWVFAVAGQALMPEHVAAITRLEAGRVIITLDQEDNRTTERARERWQASLHDAGLSVYNAVWEGKDVAGPKGLDDLLLAGARPRIRGTAVVPSAIGQRRTPRHTGTPGEVTQGVPLAEARCITARAVGDFVAQTQRNKGRALLVQTPPGAGKTRACAEAIVRHQIAARIVVGTGRLASEVAADYGYALIEGRNERNCERSDVVRALGDAAHDIERLACEEPRCPARETCAYWKQFHQQGPRVGAAEQLFNPRFLKGGALAVVHDADLLRSLIDRFKISEQVLGRSREQLCGVRREPALRLLTLIHHAVLDVPRRDDGGPGRALQGPAVWDHLAKTAARYGLNLARVIEALPCHGTLPAPSDEGVLTPEDVAAKPPATLLQLFEALREEQRAFLSGEDFNSRIRLGAGIEVVRLREHVKTKRGDVPVKEMALIVLEATPNEALVDHATKQHERLPHVAAEGRLPANVDVVQCAGRSNGHSVLRDERHLRSVFAEVAAERERFPVASPEREAAVCFREHRAQLVDLGFAEPQVLTFGAVRGLNAVAEVERLHVVGRPMPPTDDLLFLTQAIHHDEPPVARDLVLERRRYGGQPYAVAVVDFADPRASALLKSTRDDEIVQVIHRARLLSLDEQQTVPGLRGDRRSHVRLVLHTGHVVPGLRVDELHPGVGADKRE
jgi:hypothetical protein